MRDLRLAAFALPALVLMGFAFAVPLGGIVVQSLQLKDGAGPSLDAYGRALSMPLFWRVGWITFELSATAACLAILLAYPVAYFLAGLSPRMRTICLVPVLVPFWTSVLVKSFAFTFLLGEQGVLNSALRFMALPTTSLLFNRAGVILGLCHFLVPFSVFPILTNLLKQPAALKRAAAILGAGKWQIFLRVTLPLSLPAVIAAALLSLVLAMGSFVVPALLGGRQQMMIGNLIDFYVRETLDWPLAAALSVMLLVLVSALFFLVSRLPGGGAVIGQAEET